MAQRRVFPPVLFLAAFLALVACSGVAAPAESIPTPPAWPINLSHIETIVRENERGENKFQLTMPLRASCTIRGLDQALNGLQDEDKEHFSWRVFDDPEQKLRVYEVTYKFDNNTIISQQIDRLKRVVVETARANATPTPAAAGTPPPTAAGPTVTPVPTPTLGVLTQSDELELSIESPGDTAPKVWKASITLNPERLMLGPNSDSPYRSCTVPTFTYRLTMPSPISGSPNVETRADFDRQAIKADSRGNTVTWTIDLVQLANVRATAGARATATLQAAAPSSQTEMVRFFETSATRFAQTATIIADPTALEAVRKTEEPRAQTEFARLAQSFVGTPFPSRVFTLRAESAPPIDLTGILRDYAQPIIAVIGGALGAIWIFIQIRERLRGKSKST
jgi:hypothetical protein